MQGDFISAIIWSIWNSQFGCESLRRPYRVYQLGVSLAIGSLQVNRKKKMGLRPSLMEKRPCSMVVKKEHGCWTRIPKFKSWLYTYPLCELREQLGASVSPFVK